MGIPATKTDFHKELQRRRVEYSKRQAVLDVEELNRRVKDVVDGRSKLLSEEESETMLLNLGYYDD